MYFSAKLVCVYKFLDNILGTCKCLKYLFGNWYIHLPYVNETGPYKLGGLFSKDIRNMIIDACGSCEQYAKSILYFNTSKTGVDPNRRTMYEMKLSINKHVDVSFPYYERRKIESVVPGSAFVTIIPSPGCAFIVRAAINVNEITATLVLNVVKVWPLLLVSYCIATLFGILVWFTVGFFPCCLFHCYFASLLEVVKMDLF